MRINDLPNDIKEVAIRYATTIGTYDDSSKVNDAFTWSETSEGLNIWRDVSQGDYTSFYRYTQNNMIQVPTSIEEIQITEEDLIGGLSELPIEIVRKMIECQVAQGNVRDVSIFQSNRTVGKGRRGFDWDNTDEGSNFWYAVLCDFNFIKFFNRYPKKDEYPKIMMVRNNSQRDYLPRVVIKKLEPDKYVSWVDATNFEDAKNKDMVVVWEEAIDMEEYIKLKKL